MSLFKNKYIKINYKDCCRKACMFFVGLNLLQPLRLTFDASKYMLSRFKLSEDEIDMFMSRSNLMISIFAGIGAVLISFYLVMLAPRMGTTRFNNLLTILTNWLVLIFDVLTLIFFSIGGENGYFKVFFWSIVLSSFVFGANECLVLTIDPVNIPYFLLGVTCSSVQVMLYQVIFKTVMENRGVVDYNFGMVMGQLVISTLISVCVVILCSYSYGGSSLFNVLGINLVSDFILDNSSKRLFKHHREHDKYKKYLNEEVTHKIKGLEYEIVLKFDSKTNYKTTNIIKGRRFNSLYEFIVPKSSSESRSNSRNKRKGRKEDHYQYEDMEEGSRKSYNDERIDIEVKVTSLKYENMMEGLEIYRHQVDKDVKLGRIKGGYSDIGLNLYHFKQADVYSRSNLYLINVVTTQFSSQGTSEYSHSDSSNDNFHKDGHVDPVGHRNPHGHEDVDQEYYDHRHHNNERGRGGHHGRHGSQQHGRENEYRSEDMSGDNHRNDTDQHHYKGDRDSNYHKNNDRRGNHSNFKDKSMRKRDELGVYEMDYYFFVVGGRMYQYKPSKNEWVHPVELLLSLITLYRHSLEALKRGPVHRFRNSFKRGYLKGVKKLSGLHKRMFRPNRYNQQESLDDSPRSSLVNSPRSDRELENNKDNKNKELSRREFEVDESLRDKLIMLFLNNKLRYALTGSIYPLLLCLFTILALFTSIPMMGFFENLDSPLANKADMVVKLVLLFPMVMMFVFCNFDFLGHLSLQKSWYGTYKYFYVSFVFYLIASMISLIVSRNADEQDLVNNNAFIVIMTLVIVVTFHVNILVSLISLMFQKSGKLDHLTLNYLDNNIKTNSQLMAFNLFFFHVIRLVYLGIYRKYNNQLFKILYWVV